MKHTKTIALLSGALILGLGGGALVGDHIMSDPHRAAAVVNTLNDAPNTAQLSPAYFVPFNNKSFSGNYLASRHAQAAHDWNKASESLDTVLKKDPENLTNLKRAMVIAMGSGQHDKAFSYADRILKAEPDHALSIMFTAVRAFHDGEHAKSRTITDTMADGGITDFIKPLLIGWNSAALGALETDNLNQNSVHFYHGIMIADYLKKYDDVKRLLKESMTAGEITPADTARIADIYAHIGETDKALQIYQTLAKLLGETDEIKERIAKITTGEKLDGYNAITSAKQGLAQSMVDMAQILFQDYSDDSARIFSHMGLYLNPDLTEAKLLLADVTARHDQNDQAAKYYKSIPKDDERYLEAQRKASALLEDMGEIDKAEALLQKLVTEHDDLLSQIIIGDLHRNHENFDDAIKSYNKAVKMMGGEITPEYWHVHYRRGMAYERAGQWDKAEKDLLAAIEYRPEDPYILNYLAYSWADKGENLEQALDMLRTAFSLRPADGYISDSLGWVLYRMGRIDEALPYLEKSVALLPYDATINDHLGDAYWRSGRKLEARFQWNRAINNGEEEDKIAEIQAKLENGLPEQDILHDKNTSTATQQLIKIDNTVQVDASDSSANGS